MLHIVNGNATAEILKKTSPAGEILAWQEALASGPVPSNLSPEQWLETRTDYLSQLSGEPEIETRDKLERLQKNLENSRAYDEIVLWFEHDLFCQVNLIFLLSWLYVNHEKANPELICVGSFPGISGFQGLGQLSPGQLNSLYLKKHSVNKNTLKTAAEAWTAYSSSKPDSLQRFQHLQNDELRFLPQAIRAHLQRFPSTRSGIGKIEQAILQLIQGGIDEFRALFPMLNELQPAYGFGDLQIWEILLSMSRTEYPLIHIQNLDADITSCTPDAFLTASFEITQLGKQISNSEENYLNYHKPNVWLGGTLLDADNLWCWDEENDRIIRIS